MPPSIPLSFQLGSHDMTSSDQMASSGSQPSTNFRPSCVWPPAAEPRHHRYVHADEDREQEVEWLLRRVEPHRHDIAGASMHCARQQAPRRLHNEVVGWIVIGMRAGLDTPVEESVLMLGSFRFRISDCILWLSWVSVVDGIDARRGGRSEASIGSSVLNKIVDAADR